MSRSSSLYLAGTGATVIYDAAAGPGAGVSGGAVCLWVGIGHDVLNEKPGNGVPVVTADSIVARDVGGMSSGTWAVEVGPSIVGTDNGVSSESGISIEYAAWTGRNAGNSHERTPYIPVLPFYYYVSTPDCRPTTIPQH